LLAHTITNSAEGLWETSVLAFLNQQQAIALHVHLQAELQQVAEALRQSTKQLCRNLKDNPNVAENMAKVMLWVEWSAASSRREE
jgi:NTP pyrophosphatase (non-canonical NTP hydrolase)